MWITRYGGTVHVYSTRRVTQNLIMNTAINLAVNDERSLSTDNKMMIDGRPDTPYFNCPSLIL